MKLIINILLIIHFNIFGQQGQKLENQIDSIFNPYNRSTPGCAVGIIKKGQIIFNKGYGSANLNYAIAIDTNSIFDIASLTKHFTAYSILLLEQQGKLNLEDEVSRYINNFSFKNKHVKIKHLLYHTSGIKDYIHLQKVAGYNINGEYDNESIISQIQKQTTLNFTPGSSILYSNSNYILLAEIVKRVSGISLSEFCTHYIFKPLNMHNTSFVNKEFVKGKVTGYNKSDNSYKNSYNNNVVEGPVGAQSTSADITNWLENLYSGKVGGKEMINKFLSSTMLDNGKTINTHSCVLGKKSYKGLNLYLSNGDWLGFKSQIFYFPDQQVGIVILSNAGNDLNVYGKCCSVADLILENEMHSFPSLRPDKKIKASKKINKYTGEYDLGNGFKISVKYIEGSLKLKSVWDKEFLTMIQLDTNVFIVDNDDYCNKPIKFIYNNDLNGYDFIYNEIEKGHPYQYITQKKEYLKKYEGVYYSLETETIYSIILKDSNLYAHHFINPEVKLIPMKDEVFEAGHWWFDKVEFLKDTNDLITGFNLRLDRINNLEFKRLLD